tara:strand:+ start:357 stop:680 length:324 start_codon:yes stop_codon:yes gene_type:complete
MDLTREQAEIIITALHNHSSDLYLKDNIVEVTEIQNLLKGIEEEMEAKNLESQKKMIKGFRKQDFQNEKKKIEVEEANDPSVGVGSETGIERDYARQGRPTCEVCDD